MILLLSNCIINNIFLEPPSKLKSRSVKELPNVDSNMLLLE